MADPWDTPEARAAIGARIMWARELLCPNRYAFARRLKVAPSTIAKIEAGTRNPSMFLLWRICHTLRIDLDYVVQGRLSGVDPEMRELLKKDHPQLRRPHNYGNEHMGDPASRLELPRTIAP